MISRPALAPVGLDAQQKLVLMRSTQDAVDLWEERAAIYQHDGGMARHTAEAQAFVDVIAAPIQEVA